MFKEKLKTALKEAGLDEGLSDLITVTSEAEIPAAIAKLKAGAGKGSETDPPATITTEDFITSGAFNAWIEKNGFDGLLKLNTKIQSGHDSKVTKGIKSAISKVLDGGQEEPGQGGGGTPPGKGEGDEKVPAWAKALTEKIDRLENEKATTTKLEKAKAAISTSKLPKSVHGTWVGRINLDSETSYEDQVKELEKEYKTIHASIIGEEQYEFPEEGGQGEGSKKNGELSKADLEKVREKAAKLL